MKRSLLAAVALAAVLVPRAAFAGSGDAAAAEALFQRGIDLEKKGDWVEACKAYDASMKLDPSVGAQMNLGRCAEHDGRIAEAWAAFKKAKSLNAETPLAKRKANVDAFCDDEVKKLEPRLPWITIQVVVRPTAGAAAPALTQIQGLTIQRDATTVPVEGVNVPVPIDPGKHTIRVVAPGYVTSAKDIDIVETERKSVVLELVAEPPRPPGQTVPGQPVPQKSKGSALVPAGIIVASIGGAALVVSAITGGIAMSDRGRIDKLVEDKKCSEAGGSITCEPGSQAEAHDAITRGKVLAATSTVTLFAGAAVATTGIVIAIVGATSSRRARSDVGVMAVPVVAPGAAGVAAFGTF